jgi:hypothetical protein
MTSRASYFPIDVWCETGAPLSEAGSARRTLLSSGILGLDVTPYFALPRRIEERGPRIGRLDQRWFR